MAVSKVPVCGVGHVSSSGELNVPISDRSLRYGAVPDRYVLLVFFIKIQNAGESRLEAHYKNPTKIRSVILLLGFYWGFYCGFFFVGFLY